MTGQEAIHTINTLPFWERFTDKEKNALETATTSIEIIIDLAHTFDEMLLDYKQIGVQTAYEIGRLSAMQEAHDMFCDIAGKLVFTGVMD